jgi:hypothetical protein
VELKVFLRNLGVIKGDIGDELEILGMVWAG